MTTTAMIALQRFYLRRETVEVPMLVAGTKVNTSEELVEVVRRLTKDEVQEVCLAFFLDSQNQLLGYLELARGGLDWVTWDGRTLFAAALLCGAKSIVLTHNHPSGVAKPSRMDVVGMKKLIPAAELLGLSIVDHIVVTDKHHVSMSDYGLLPPRSKLVREAAEKREEDLDQEAREQEVDNGRS